MRHDKHTNRAGFSILEMTVTFTFLTITMIPLFGSMQKSIDSHRMLASRDQLEERVRRVTAQLAFRLRGATVDSLQSLPVFPDSAPTVDFQRLTEDAPYVDLQEADPFEEPLPEPTPAPTKGTSGGTSGGKSGGNGLGLEEGAGLEQFSTLTFADGKLELAIGAEKRVIARGLANVQFSRLGRTIIATVRADGRDASGHFTSITRRVNVTVRN